MKALELIASARGLKPEYRYLTVRLRLEQQRCYNWASASGLLAYMDGDEGALDENLLGVNRTKVLEALIELEFLGTSFIKQRMTYEGLVPDVLERGSIPKKLTGEQEPWVDEINLMPDLKKLWTQTRDSIRTAHLPERLKWAVVDKERYESLIDKLKALNDALLDLMDSNLTRAIHASTQETKLSVLQLHNKLDDLDQLIKALLPTAGRLSTSANTSIEAIGRGLSSPSSSSATRRYNEDAQAEDDFAITELARFKASLQEGAMEEPNVRRYSSNRANIMIPRERIRLDPDQSDGRSRSYRSNATYNKSPSTSIPVWVEWKPYKPADSQRRPPPVISERVKQLSSLLSDPAKPSSLRVPTCLGYFDDGVITRSIQGTDSDDDEDDRPPEWRFGLVFERDEASTVMSLQDLLTTAPVPSLTMRVTLATILTKSVLSLHAVNWLHKGLRSSNVLFVTPRTTADGATGDSVNKTQLGSPLLAGFDYARRAGADEQTEVPTARAAQVFYRHPEAHGVEEGMGERYIKTFDIYSLGVILTEVALWRTAGSLLSKDRKTRDPSSPSKPPGGTYKDHRDRLLNDESIQGALESSAGSRFAAVVRICLEGRTALGLSDEDDESSALVGVKLQRSFHRNVVRRLEDIQI
jgi:hypothetical protein